MTYHQKGIGSLNLIVILAVIGFFMMCAFKLVPVYSENQYITNALKSLRDKDKPVEQMSASEIRNHLQSFYTVNGIRAAGAQNIEVDRVKNRQVITINYEVKVPLIYNISVVVDFQNYMDTTKPEQCCSAPSDFRPKK